MDTITHGIVGALVGKAFFAGRDVPADTARSTQPHSESAPTARVAIVACTLGSIFPDIDVFAGPIARNPLAIMEWHRNITHSLVMLPVWAVLLAAVSLPLARRIGWKPPSFAKLVGIYALALATHVFLDVATSFGTMVWSPVKYSRIAWDWLFILDLTFTSIALVPQFVAWCYREPREFGWRSGAVWGALTVGAFGAYALAETAGYRFRIWVVVAASAAVAALIFLPAIEGIGFRWRRASWCRVGLVALCAYVAFAAAAHRKALAYVEEFAASHHLRVENLVALPLPPTLTHWAGVISTPEGVWRTTFHVPGGNVERTQLYADAGSDRYVAEAKQLRDVQVYLWFARFPVYQVSHGGNGHTRVDISDVRFFRDLVGEPRRIRYPAEMHIRATGFMFEVEFDGLGRVVRDGWASTKE
ncbi:MAG: metal-dependent hydrolase [Acidobacteriia bacterium]|nr:metal-dependent hydrolase [Terriglobia bacterium]